MKIFLFAVVLPYVLAAHVVDLDLQRALQAEVDKGKPTEVLFRSFKTVFGKQYEDGEEVIRQKIFEQNVNYIKAHNLRYARNETTYYLGVNQFSDLTHKEFLALYTSKINLQNVGLETACSSFLPPLDIELPTSVDWRTKGYVTPVKNQGQCGSCWAFSTTGSLEGQHFRKTKKLVSLSEQQLVDCSKENDGCNGGWQYKAFNYIKSVGGIEGESDYPYTAREGQCRFNKKYVRATVSGCVKLPKGSESSLQQAVASQGPISVSIDANHQSFQSYRGGIYYEPSCSQVDLDHAVLVVGYGSNSEGDFWLVKNSWAKSWGNAGYINMARNRGNNCGIATGALYPTV